jgi:hypothetical protein
MSAVGSLLGEGNMSLKDQNAFITGASRGIGEAIARSFAAEDSSFFRSFKIMNLYSEIS